MTWLRLALAAAALGSAVAAAAPAQGATIVTTSNQKFTGRILQETPQDIVIQTASGTVTVPRASIATLERDVDPNAPKIVPEIIAPANAPQAFEQAKSAIAQGNWAKAGSLLAGLLELPNGTFPHENRLAATTALVTCHLQVKDPAGAAKAFQQRAKLVLDESDKRRLLAAGEALEKLDALTGLVIDGQAVQTYDEVIRAAMTWKAGQLLAEAKDLGAKATDLNDAEKFELAAKRVIAKLDEADLYTPGFSAQHRQEALAAIVENVIAAAKTAVEICTRERALNISRYWKTSAASVKAALVYNDYAANYLNRRQAAEDGLANLSKVLAAKYQAAETVAKRQAEIDALFKQLDDLQYHIQLPGMPYQLKITLRRIGSQFGK